jgi:hypothetical protein
MSHVPQLGVGPPWTCGDDDDVVHWRRACEQLRWSGPLCEGSGSERGLTNSSSYVSLCRGMMNMGWR